MSPDARSELEAETDAALRALDEEYDLQLDGGGEGGPKGGEEGVRIGWSVRKVSAIRYQSWRESRRATLLALQRRKAVVALIGPPGVGKTVMLDRLAEFLLSRHKKVVVQRGAIDLDRVPQDATLMIDDADDIPLADFEQLGLRPDLGFVLAGDQRLVPVVRKLTRRDMPLTGRSRVISLEPVVGNDLHAYVEARLPKRHKWHWEFAPEVVTRIAELSGGVPGKLNLLIDGAAGWAMARRQKLITVEMVEKAAVSEAPPMPDDVPAERTRRPVKVRKSPAKPAAAPPRWSLLGWLRPKSR